MLQKIPWRLVFALYGPAIGNRVWGILLAFANVALSALLGALALIPKTQWDLERKRPRHMRLVAGLAAILFLLAGISQWQQQERSAKSQELIGRAVVGLGAMTRQNISDLRTQTKEDNATLTTNIASVASRVDNGFKSLDAKVGVAEKPYAFKLSDFDLCVDGNCNGNDIKITTNSFVLGIWNKTLHTVDHYSVAINITNGKLEIPSGFVRTVLSPTEDSVCIRDHNGWNPITIESHGTIRYSCSASPCKMSVSLSIKDTPPFQWTFNQDLTHL